MKSEAQIEREWKARAAWLLIRAWRRVEFCARQPDIGKRIKDACDVGLRDATALADEWGLDPLAILEAAEATPTASTRAAEE